MTNDQQHVLDGFLSKCQDPVEVSERGDIVRLDITRPWGTPQTAIISPQGRLDWTTPVVV